MSAAGDVTRFLVLAREQALAMESSYLQECARIRVAVRMAGSERRCTTLETQMKASPSHTFAHDSDLNVFGARVSDKLGDPAS